MLSTNNEKNGNACAALEVTAIVSLTNGHEKESKYSSDVVAFVLLLCRLNTSYT